MSMCAEQGFPFIKRALRMLDVEEIEWWQAYYRIQAKDRDKEHQDAEAKAARARAEHRLKAGLS